MDRALEMSVYVSVFYMIYAPSGYTINRPHSSATKMARKMIILANHDLFYAAAKYVYTTKLMIPILTRGRYPCMKTSTTLVSMSSCSSADRTGASGSTQFRDPTDRAVSRYFT